MSNKYPGGLVTLNPPAQDPALGAATNGVWTMDQALNAETNRSWAMYDPYYNSVVLNLHGNQPGGVTAVQNNTFLDSSSNNFTITPNGNTTQGAFNPYGSNWSTYYTGVNDTNGTYVAANAAFSFGTGDFTVEAWVNIPAISNTNGKIIFDSRPNATNGSYWLFGLSNTGQLTGVTMTTGGTTITSTNPIPTNQWVHVAYTRASGNLNLWVNGVSVASASGNTNNISSDTLWIGRNAFSTVATDSWFSGYMSNARIVKGVAVYTGTFTPPTAPLQNTQPAGNNIAAITGTQTSLLIQQSNRLVDNSTYGFTIATNNTFPSVQRFGPFLQNLPYESSRLGGSGYFDGSGDYLDAPSNAAFGMGTGDFTLEVFTYVTAYPGLAAVLIDLRGGSDPATRPCLEYSSTGTINYRVSGANQISGGTIPLNAWAHVALCRSSGVTKLYLNGTQVGSSYTDTNDYGSSSRCRVGADDDGSLSVYVTGYMADVRIVKGTAVYTTTFTPPTAPLTAIANTSLLLSYTNGAIFDNATMNDLETVGNAQISTSVKKYGTGSMYFDGSGDWLYASGSPSFDFYSGDVTIEAWVYVTSAATTQIFVSCTPTGGSGFSAWTFMMTSSGFLQMDTFYAGTEQTITATNNALTANTWYHVAYTRASGTSRLFVNGTSCTFSGSISQQIISGGYPLTVGAGRYSGYTSPMTGYIDDLRITKGVARYTGTFTPPTSQLQDQ